MKLIIAEKNSVAQSIAKVLGANERKEGYYIGSQYMVSWCVGHLVELADAAAYDEKYAKWRYEDLPIIPPAFQYRVSKGKEKQFNILKKLMEDSRVTSLVCATDAGREGELIFRFVYDQAGCTKPFERLWISSMEDAAIQEGFARLKDGKQYDNLYASALCRAKADWLIGINQTRQFSVLYGPMLNVGRVQTPTLTMLVERDAQINGFQKEKYYHARISCGGFEAASEKINDRTGAEQVQAACHKQSVAVASVKREEKTVNPPKLYDLTTLQREANRLYGYTANQTLEYTQSLYEKKLVTYPRTDSQFLTEDMQETAVGIATDMLSILPFSRELSFAPDVGCVINNAKVSDHHAIIPTAQAAGTDLNTIPEIERAVLLLISARLLCATAGKHTLEAVTAVLECSDYSFIAKGKTVMQNGWKEIEQRFKASIKNKGKEDEETEMDKALPPLSKGDSFDSVDAFITEHTTSPPKPYTEDTLLAAMETAGNEDLDKDLDTEKKGLGTPATRASIIEKLVLSGFAERKKKQLLPTKKGANLIAVLPEEVKSPKMTAEWENALTRIATGNQSPEEFMQGIEKLTSLLVRNHAVPLPDMAGLFREQKEAIGSCPRCGKDVVEGKKNFYCTNKDCKFSMWKDDRFFTGKKKTLTKKMAADLLNTGKTPVMGLYSEKKDSTYDAVVVLADTGEQYVNYKLEFAKK